MSISFTLTREHVERLLAGFDSISMELDEVKSALSESATKPPQNHSRELKCPKHR